MPALLVHLTLAQQAVDRADAPAQLVEAAHRREDALLLGSVLPDLPYHARFGQQLLRHLTGREYLLSEWGDIFHTRRSGQLALGLLRHLVRAHLPDEERWAVLALLAGYLCHHAVDRVVHPTINLLVARHEGDFSLPPSAVHERLERYQSLFFHQDLLGHDILCTPFPRRLVGQIAGAGLLRPTLERPLARALRAACLETHGRAPTAAEWSDWLWGTTAYGTLLSTPVARTERPKAPLAEVRERYYQGPGVDLIAPLSAGLEATLDAWRAAVAVLNADRVSAEVREVFLRAVPDVDLGTGS